MKMPSSALSFSFFFAGYINNRQSPTESHKSDTRALPSCTSIPLYTQTLLSIQPSSAYLPLGKSLGSPWEGTPTQQDPHNGDHTGSPRTKRVMNGREPHHQKEPGGTRRKRRVPSQPSSQATNPLKAKHGTPSPEKAGFTPCMRTRTRKRRKVLVAIIIT